MLKRGKTMTIKKIDYLTSEQKVDFFRLIKHRFKIIDGVLHKISGVTDYKPININTKAFFVQYVLVSRAKIIKFLKTGEFSPLNYRNKTGHNGISYVLQHGKYSYWLASITRKGKTHSKYFKTKEEAVRSRAIALEKLNKENN
jgi:hypothetical protein